MPHFIDTATGETFDLNQLAVRVVRLNELAGMADRYEERRSYSSYRRVRTTTWDAWWRKLGTHVAWLVFGLAFVAIVANAAHLSLSNLAPVCAR